MNETRNKVLFTFPVVVATHSQTLWQSIEPYVDHLDFPCEKFIVSLKSRDDGTATYNVSCVVDSEAIRNSEFRDIANANHLASIAKWRVGKPRMVDFNKEIESKYKLDVMELIEEKQDTPEFLKNVKLISPEYQKEQVRREESVAWAATFQKPVKDDRSVARRYNHWINRKLSKADQLKFFGSAKEADEYVRQLKGQVA